MFTEVVAAAQLESAKPRQQVLRLGKCRRWRLVQPTQLVRRNTPSAKLQRQARKVCLEDFGTPMRCQLVVLCL
ncbi:hypothetical protein D3C73_1235690 [compost metagenome]